MSELEIDKLRSTFHVEPIRTRGNQKGIILKFDFFYLKIYDGSSEREYSVQLWEYGKSLPTKVEKVRSENLIKFIQNL